MPLGSCHRSQTRREGLNAEKLIPWTITRRKRSGCSFPRIWTRDTFNLPLLPGWLLSSLLERRMASYAPAKIIDASMNKRSRTSIHYPNPRIDRQLKGAKIFTKLDLRWGYNNVRSKRRIDSKQHLSPMENFGNQP